MLEVKINHTSVKHEQKIGFLVQTHEPMKRQLKNYGKTERHEHIYVDLDVFKHNTNNHTARGCRATLIFNVKKRNN